MSQIDYPVAETGDQFLLATKLVIPPTRSVVTVRPRLIDRLQAALHGPLTLLTAPAGSGKTTLLSSVLQQHQWASAWVSLDGGDDDLTRFWSYVLAALESVQPGASKEARPLLAALRQVSIEAILTTLLNTLAQVERDIILVLDDYHSITAQPVHTSLAFFLEHLPPRLHAVIATRADPLLPLARWRTRGRLTEFRTSDLRFTPEETAVFFQQVAGLQLSTEEIEALDMRAEGWIAGLQLAALSMQGRKDISGFIKAFTGSHRYIVDYLMQEVFTLQPAEVQAFLLHTSILERMCGPLCEAVNKQADGQAMLERVEQANLFLQPLDDERHWYRYHHLFAELLRYRLQREQPELIPLLHSKAGTWYEQHGLLPEAIQHALAAKDFPRAAQLIEAVGVALTKQGAFATLSSWLDQLPAEELQSRPGLSVLRAWLLFLTGQYADAERQLQEIERRYHVHAARQSLERLPEPAAHMLPVYHLIGEIAAIRASIAIIQEESERTIVFAREALTYLPEDDISTGLVTWYLGIAYWIAGDVGAAVQAMAEAVARNRASDNLYMAFMATHELASFQAVQGYLHRAEETYRQAIQLAHQQGGATVVLGPIHVGLGRLQYEWNNLEAAGRLLREGVEQCLYMENSRTALEGYLLLAQLSHAQRDQEGLQELWEKIDRLARNPNIPPTLVSFSAAVQARLALAQGDLEAAGRWLRRCSLRAQDEVNPLRINEYLILARVLIAQGSFDDAFTCLDSLLRLVQTRGRIKNSIEILVLQALAHQTQRKQEIATDLLERALLIAEPEGYIRLFIDEGAALADLLVLIHTQLYRQHPVSQQDRKRPSASYIEKLLTAAGVENSAASGAAFRPPDTPPLTTASPLAEPLSERELEVLRLLAEGYSNREIADRLVLAVSTVKWYVNIVYGKLHVQSRTRAVARARELNLL
ncbi:MAG TPA: LuxR C-terminal-related transcriptional regulator [Ktedonobacteraceae bacterium]|nr:LuxR C-terminal-related transcriptional regulator [Ktedonobacteraceae bacterium]